MLRASFDEGGISDQFSFGPGLLTNPPQTIMSVSDETSSEILELIPKELNKNSAGSSKALGQVLRAVIPEIIPEDAHMALESTARFSNIQFAKLTIYFLSNTFLKPRANVGKES